MQWSPANTEFASFVFSNCRVTSIKLGHLAGNSADRIFCNVGMSWARIGVGEVERIGRRRSRRLAFSSSGICLFAAASSLGAHALLTRFLRYTTAAAISRAHRVCGFHTGQPYAVVLFCLKDVKQGIDEAWLFLGLFMIILVEMQYKGHAMPYISQVQLSLTTKVSIRVNS